MSTRTHPLCSPQLMIMVCIRLWVERRPAPGLGECGVVLAGVKTKPCGWPTASLDPASGQHRKAAAGSRPEGAQDQESSGGML